MPELMPVDSELGLILSGERQRRRCDCDRVRSEIGRCSAVSELMNVEATACSQRRSTVTG